MTTTKFNQNLEKVESLLFGFAMKLTKNKENAKDLMQETLMRSFKHKDRFKAGTNFKSWMTTIMYNAFINHYRKKQTRNKVMKPIEDFNYLLESTITPGNAHALILRKELNNIINRLSDDFKTPFKMFYEGYHYDEIAASIKLPIGTVKSRIYYARKKLKTMIQNRYDIENLLAA